MPTRNAKPRKRQRLIAVDTETTGTEFRLGHRPFSVQTCDDLGRTLCWEWRVDPFTRHPSIPASHVASIRRLIESHDAVVFHNAKFDIRALRSIDAWPDGWDIHERVHDTLLMSHVLNSQEDHGLKTLSLKYLDIPDTDQKALQREIIEARRAAKSKGWPISPVVAWDSWLPKAVNPRSTALSAYGVQDAVRTMQLYLLYRKYLAEYDLQRVYERERRLLPVVMDMEDTGVCVHGRDLDAELKRYAKVERDAERVVVRKAKQFGLRGFNIRSGQQVGALLYDRLGIPVHKTTTTSQGLVNRSVDRESLTAIYQHRGHFVDPQTGETFRKPGRLGKRERDVAEILEGLVTFRSAKTACGYLTGYAELRDVLQATGDYTIHPSLNQVGTHTTRFSCSNPNAQNISKKASMPLRAVFGPRSGCIWYDVDYDQLELRIFAVAAREQSLLDAFDRGEDIHGYVAQRIFGLPAEKVTKEQRRIAKGINFGLIYGAGRRKIDALGGPGTYANFRKLFPSIDRYMAETTARAEDCGFVETLGGYRLHVPQGRSYAGVNYIVQGTAGDVLKNALIGLDDFLRGNPGSPLAPSTRLILPVHDEIILELPFEKSALGRSYPGLDSYHQLLGAVTSIMERAGRDLGVVTPVTPAVVLRRWSEPVEIKGDVTLARALGLRECPVASHGPNPSPNS